MHIVETVSRPVVFRIHPIMLGLSAGPGAWTFLWFVCFCLLAHQWSLTSQGAGVAVDAAQAVVAFSFFSVGSWVSGPPRAPPGVPPGRPDR